MAGGQWFVGGLHQHPGNRRGVAQVDRQFQMRGAEEGMLAGQAADLAGQIRVARQVLIPELRMALASDAIKAMTATVGEYRAEG